MHTSKAALVDKQQIYFHTSWRSIASYLTLLPFLPHQDSHETSSTLIYSLTHKVCVPVLLNFQTSEYFYVFIIMVSIFHNSFNRYNSMFLVMELIRALSRLR